LNLFSPSGALLPQSAPDLEQLNLRFYLPSLIAVAAILAFGTISGFAPVCADSNLRLEMQDVRGTYRAEANSSNTHRMRVRRGQNVRVVVAGEGDTNLDLFVYDPYGVEVSRDIRPDDNCVAYFRANAGGLYTMRVTNLGDVWNQYSLAF
jgi:hypothetical protein